MTARHTRATPTRIGLFVFAGSALLLTCVPVHAFAQQPDAPHKIAANVNAANIRRNDELTLAGLRPGRDDLAEALIAYFTGHLGISTTMRAHEGIGTAQSHLTVSTAPLTIAVSFHEPVSWTGWLLYTHESTQVGAGMSYVRGAVHTEEGELIASFAQFGDMARVIEYREFDLDVQVIGHTAVVTFRFDMVYEREQNTREHSTGRDLWVFARHDDRWLVVWRTILDVVDEMVH